MSPADPPAREPAGASAKHPFTWCRLEDRFLPTYRCMLCRTPCQPQQARGESTQRAIVEQLLAEGKIKEYFVMSPQKTADNSVAAPNQTREDSYYVIEDGKLKPFAPEDYSSSVLYQAVEAFAVERRFAKPEEKQEVLYQGKRPSKQTLPVLIQRGSGDAVLGAWADLESNPQQLAGIEEVVAVRPVRQIFVLRRK